MRQPVPLAKVSSLCIDERKRIDTYTTTPLLLLLADLGTLAPSGRGWYHAGNLWWLVATRMIGDYIMSCPARRAVRWFSGWRERRGFGAKGGRVYLCASSPLVSIIPTRASTF